MVSRHPPFLKASNNDQYYRLLIGNREDLFWAYHSKNKSSDSYYSESFKSLIQWLFSWNPIERPSISEIKSHEWFNGPVPTHKQIKDALYFKRATLAKENYHPDAGLPSGSPDPTLYGSETFRSPNGENVIERIAAPYYAELKRYTQFFSSEDPDTLLRTLAVFAEKK
jgi:serine/threonine protein kinase